MKRITDDGEIVDINCEDCVTGIVHKGPGWGGAIQEAVQFKTPNNHNTLDEAYRTATYCEDPTLTDQSFKEDADINVIIDRVMKGGEVPIILPEHFGSDQRVDLYTASERIAESNATFYKLNPHIREEFQNDPRRWERQVLKDLDKGDTENLQRMGIDIHKPPVAAPVGTPATATTVGAGDPGKAPADPPKAPQGAKD